MPKNAEETLLAYCTCRWNGHIKKKYDMNISKEITLFQSFEQYLAGRLLLWKNFTTLNHFESANCWKATVRSLWQRKTKWASGTWNVHMRFFYIFNEKMTDNNINEVNSLKLPAVSGHFNRFEILKMPTEMLSWRINKL